MDGSFFGFHSRPFAAAPVVESYFPAQTIELARQNLIRIIQRAEGPGMVVGAAGVGKSLLCRLLAEYFHDTFDVVVLSSAKICTRKALLQSILFELNRPYRNLEEGELRLSLLDFLQPGQSKANGMLLLLDEAHSLPMRLLDEVRMITNLVRDGQPRARLVLAGNPRLDERFTHPKLESFSQRLAARCYLEPLSYDETMHYVRSQINAAGGNPDSLFTDEALQSVHRASDGIPRLINQVCDHALLLACAGGRSRLDAACIGEAWADLQQLPVPWYDDDAQPASDVEFGQLEDIADSPTDDAEDQHVLETVASEEVLAYDNTPELITTNDLAIAVYDTGWQETAQPMEEGEVLPGQLDAESAVGDEVLADGHAEIVIRSEETFQEMPELPDSDVSESVETARIMNDTQLQHDSLFGDAFDEEEVVIDRYASLEIEAFRGRPRVISDESHEFASALAGVQMPDETDSAVEETAADSDADSREPEALDEITIAENDPPGWQATPENVTAPLFEYTVLESAPDRAPPLDASEFVKLAMECKEAAEPTDEACCVEFPGVQESGMDDRDLIILDDPGTDQAPTPEASNAPESSQAADYTELFAQLRKV